MKKLSEKTWSTYPLATIFTVDSGVRLTTSNKVSGKTPFIGATDNSNGVTGFISNTNKSLDNHVLGVNYNGAPGIAFYHPYKAIFSDDVKRLHLKHFNANPNTMLFMKEIIMKQRFKYSYGYKFKADRMLRQKLNLPVTSKNQPDYPYMEQYVKLVKEKLINRYKNFLQAQLVLLKHVDIPELAEARWKPFRIDDIFDEIASGKIKSVKKLISQENGISLLGATNRNNGIVDNISRLSFDNKKIQSGNCIAFVQTGEGSVGYATYQPKSFISSGNANYGYASWLNPFTGLFFVTSQNKLRLKYNYGYIRSKNRLQADKVMLPVDRFNKPDYQYMEQYVKNLMLQKYQQYLVFLNNSEL